MGIATKIDHTLLKPDARQDQILRLCSQAERHHFHSVCVNPTWVKLCSTRLDGTGIKVGVVVGFPLGANLPEIKAHEAILAVTHGADEVHMAMNTGALKSNDIELVKRDMQMVRDAAPKAKLGVIIETDFLTDDQKVLACHLVEEAFANFIVISTSLVTGGDANADIRLMRQSLVDTKKVGIKVFGGIPDFATARALLDAGATRLGCWGSVVIVEEEGRYANHW